MTAPIHPRQVRAARALLAMSQEELASAAEVGLATLKRFESGKSIRGKIERSLRSALEKQGIILLDDASLVDGNRVAAGVAVRAAAFSASLSREPGALAGASRKRTRSV